MCRSFRTCLALWAFAASTRAADLDLTRAVIVAAPGLAGPERQAVRMLGEEVARQSWLRWDTADALPSDGRPAIVVGRADAVRKLVDVPNGAVGREGYRIGIRGSVVYVAGDDPRGTLFGVGRLLRELRIERERATLPEGFAVASAPKTPLRGHQIGYRPKTNSYDGWTIPMWEQYIRDLIVFGCNAIELIPPRSDDAADSPLFPDPPLRTMTAVSRIADSYGIDVWVWYPALDANLVAPKVVEAAIAEWGAVFAALPRVDAVFVPGGDPGHTPPKALFAFLERQTANLRRYHPKAQMWVSPQSFDAVGTTEFLALANERPAWLAGVVHGPQVRLSLAELRAALPKELPIRDYPDITHNRTCQYPVPDWDVAFALTIAREGSNPRPTQMAAIHRHARPHTAGFITYSEGCHDDVNKAVWSALGWDDAADVTEILRQYGRTFVGPELAERFAEGLLMLERNWVGPARNNTGIIATLAHFQALERDAGPREKLNWRFQQALYRAYYDAVVRARVRHELDATNSAREYIGEFHQLGTKQALDYALAELDLADETHPAPALRARVGELAEALFQSVRAQLSVRKYHAIDVGRGASLDGIDAPLSDAAWLRSEIAAIRKLGNDAARARMRELFQREMSAAGEFYDDLGDPKRQPHLVRDVPYERDPGYRSSPLMQFGRGGPPPLGPRAWWTAAMTHYDTPMQMRYPGLDRTTAYRVRVVYGVGEGRKVRLTAGDDLEVHAALAKPLEPLEFAVPAAATAGGELTLTWRPDAGSGGTGRGCFVAEVWLLNR